MSENIIAISGGTASGGLLLLLIVVAAISIVVCLLLRHKRKTYHCNMSTNVAYCTTKRNDHELDDTYYVDLDDNESVPIDTHECCLYIL